MIQALNHPGARELSIAHAAKCITTLRVASRSGSYVIRHEKPTEPGEKNVDEPRAASPGLADWVILTFSFDPKPLAKPTEYPSRGGR